MVWISSASLRYAVCMFYRKLNMRKQHHAHGYLVVLYLFVVVSGFTLTRFGGFATMGAISYAEAQRRTQMRWLFGAIFVCIVLVLFASYSAAQRALKKRIRSLEQYAALHGLQRTSMGVSPTLVRLSERFSERVVDHVFGKDDWSFGDFHYTRIVRTKYGTRRSYTLHYAVGAFTLPRTLPNVFFDSKHTGGREFRIVLESSQMHSLEGDFDDHFRTYFNKDYTIDSLSFITPEVMQTMLDARAYDIEIYGNTLYLYNELENMPDQIEDVRRHGEMIRHALLNNIVSYRDERIDFQDGRKTVSVQGIELNQPLWPHVLTLALCCAALAVIGVISYVENQLISSFLFYGVLFVLVPLLRAIHKIRQIRARQRMIQAAGNTPYGKARTK